MDIINNQTIADMIFQLNWKSSDAIHTDVFAGRGVNFWRDLLPAELRNRLSGKKPGDRIELEVQPGELFSHPNGNSVRTLKRSQFDPGRLNEPQIPPQQGRFYPKGLLKDMPGIFQANIQPFRCLQVENCSVQVDLGHPLANKKVRLSVTVGKVDEKISDRGGALQDWMEIITEGPGMQARWQDRPTDFFSGAPFQREDERPDAFFYDAPRFVQHLDGNAIEIVRQLYERFLKNNQRVLDLMSSWTSHVSKNVQLTQLTGIGLNASELQKNDRLTDFHVVDLNEKPILPLPTTHYDAAICTASVEYLTSPIPVFREVARVLRPQGIFAVLFSDRWFPTKAIRIWTELHPFERMGLVLEYFRQSGRFENLQTYSMRGLPRPRDDKYFGQQRFSDPIFAVWGQRRP